MGHVTWLYALPSHVLAASTVAHACVFFKLSQMVVSFFSWASSDGQMARRVPSTVAWQNSAAAALILSDVI
jgi:hypothetical protein